LKRHEYHDRLIEKDNDTIRLCRRLYGIDVGIDRSPFDLVLDLSQLIREPTLDASLQSIRMAHALIKPAAAWYLTGRTDFKAQFREAIAELPGIVTFNRLLC